MLKTIKTHMTAFTNYQKQTKPISLPLSKKTICLNMIVKNEAHIIRDTFDNILKYIHVI